MLTKLEEQVLVTVWKFDGEGYGVNVFNHLEKIVEKKITLGVIYDTMERLRKKGCLDTQMGDPTPVRGGMRKKYYQITKAGIEALVKAQETHEKVMEGFGQLLTRYKAERP